MQKINNFMSAAQQCIAAGGFGDNQNQGVAWFDFDTTR